MKKIWKTNFMHFFRNVPKYLWPNWFIYQFIITFSKPSDQEYSSNLFWRWFHFLKSQSYFYQHSWFGFTSPTLKMTLWELVESRSTGVFRSAWKTDQWKINKIHLKYRQDRNRFENRTVLAYWFALNFVFIDRFLTIWQQIFNRNKEKILI